MSGGFAKLRLKVGLGFYDVELLGGRNLVQSNSAFGIGVALSTDGVLLRLKVNRGGHKISIPVLLSTEARPGIATGVAALAISVAAVVQVYVVRPIRRAQIAEAKAEARVIRMAGMEKAREDAEAARELMHVTVERSREREEQVPRGGLIITRAFYGAGIRLHVQKLNHFSLPLRRQKTRRREQVPKDIHIYCFTPSLPFTPSPQPQPSQKQLRIWNPSKEERSNWSLSTSQTHYNTSSKIPRSERLILRENNI